MDRRSKVHVLPVLALMIATAPRSLAPLRASALEWRNDAGEHLRAIESDSARATRERMRSSIQRDSCGWSAPRSPAAGRGSVR